MMLNYARYMNYAGVIKNKVISNLAKTALIVRTNISYFIAICSIVIQITTNLFIVLQDDLSQNLFTLTFFLQKVSECKTN